MAVWSCFFVHSPMQGKYAAEAAHGGARNQIRIKDHGIDAFGQPWSFCVVRNCRKISDADCDCIKTKNAAPKSKNER